jgi:hypothetical protein
MNPWKKWTLTLSLTLAIASGAAALTISDEEAQAAGRRIWQNECGGRIDGLTSWNQGEDFASLGIGHFIWYPKGRRGPFEESFPRMVAFLKSQGVKLPAWLEETRECPWNSRQEFLADFQGPRLTSLRQLLAGSVAQQARFAVERLEGTLPLMLEAAPASEKDRIQRRFNALAAAPGGVYALVDYVNFKGEGVKLSERYAGKGWGLLQVLEGMQGENLQAFAASADRCLTERVKNSPPARGEARWLTGWRNRLSTYTER